MEEFLFGFVFNDVFNSIVTAAAAGVAGFFIAKVTHLTKKERARLEIDKCTAREYVRNAYREHVIDGHAITEKRWEEIEKAFNAYTALGGNGTAAQYMSKLREIPVTMITE